MWRRYHHTTVTQPLPGAAGGGGYVVIDGVCLELGFHCVGADVGEGVVLAEKADLYTERQGKGGASLVGVGECGVETNSRFKGRTQFGAMQ